MAGRTVGRQRLFDVRVGGNMSNGAPYNNRISLHATMEAAWAAMMGILTRWGQAQGAVSPGARVSIVDTRDGGVLFSAEYLGFEPNLLSEG